MKKSDKSNFINLLIAVFELYGKKMSTTLVNLYWLALERFSFEDISRAINFHVS